MNGLEVDLGQRASVPYLEGMSSQIKLAIRPVTPSRR
jgi:hypothetical protein